MTDELKARIHLVQANRGAVMVMLQRAVASGEAIEHVAAIVADTRDSVGGALARALAAKDAGLDVDAEARRANTRSEILTVIAVVPAVLAAQLFAETNPSVSEGIAHPAMPGRLRVVVVGAGGATLIQVPIDQLREVGVA